MSEQPMTEDDWRVVFAHDNPSPSAGEQVAMKNEPPQDVALSALVEEAFEAARELEERCGHGSRFVNPDICKECVRDALLSALSAQPRPAECEPMRCGKCDQPVLDNGDITCVDCLPSPPQEPVHE